MQLITN